MRRRTEAKLLRGAVYAAAGVTAGVLLLLLYTVLRRGLPRLSRELFSWSGGSRSLLPALVNTLSVTALALADSVNEALGNEYHYVYDRSQVRQKRDGREIGISAVRGGTIVGEHEVIFAGTDEVIEFKHTAYSRNVFAKGAVEAAKFLKGREPGMYDMGDVIQF